MAYSHGADRNQYFDSSIELSTEQETQPFAKWKATWDANIELYHYKQSQWEWDKIIKYFIRSGKAGETGNNPKVWRTRYQRVRKEASSTLLYASLGGELLILCHRNR